MDQLLQQFERPVVDHDGETYSAYAYGHSRPGDTWQGWLVFERLRDGRRFTTEIETTQSNADSVSYWATGLSETYLEGALDRALRPQHADARAIATPPPLVDAQSDSAVREERLVNLERDILAFFAMRRAKKLPTRELFDALPHAHADVIRALEEMEKTRRLVVRQTEEGNDWLFLTDGGAEAVAAERNALPA